MSVSVYVAAIRNLDDKFRKMIKAKKACEEAGVEYPKELIEYFGVHAVGESEEYLRKELSEVDIKYDLVCTEGRIEHGEGMTIDLTKIPGEFTKLRIYMDG